MSPEEPPIDIQTVCILLYFLILTIKTHIETWINLLSALVNLEIITNPKIMIDYSCNLQNSAMVFQVQYE